MGNVQLNDPNIASSYSANQFGISLGMNVEQACQNYDFAPFF